MSRLGMNMSRFSSGAKRVAAIDRQGDWWRVVVAEAGADGRILHADSIPVSSPQDLASLIHGQKATRVVRVAPAGATVASVVCLPDGPDEDLLAALELMAEAELPSRAPAWRRGFGLVDLPAPSGHRAGLLYAWVGEPDADPAPGLPRERWVGEPAALAALLAGAESGHAVAADRDRSSIGMLVAGGEHTLVRSCRESAPTADAWGAVVGAAAAECGIETAARPSDQSVALDDASAQRLGERAAFPIGPEWIDRYGVAAGAALGAVSAPDSTLFALSADEPTPEVTAPERVARWVSAPARAWTLIAASIVVMVVGYWASSALEASVLGSKIASGNTEELNTDALRQREAFMEELNQRRWPITKLLAEISRAAPVGVEADSVRVTPGEPITLRCRADSSTKLSPFLEALNSSGVFEARALREERAEDGFEFELEIDVRRAHQPGKDLEDFSEQTLGHRLYGEEYDAVAAQDRAAEEQAEEKRQARKDSGGRSGSRSGQIFDGTDRRAETVEPVPEPLEQSDIDQMDRATAAAEFAQRRAASARADIDDDDKRRLREEAALLRSRLEALKGGG